jgi:hypothetical protein
MTSMNDHDSTMDAMGGFLAAATQNARCRGDIAIATTRVIAKRVALGMAATFNPLRADRAEFSRMVPEKVEAFSTAGMVMLKQSGQANRQMMRFASDEVMTTARGHDRDDRLFQPGRPGRRARQVRACVVRSGDFEPGSQWESGHSGRRPLRWRPFGQTVVANAERLGR